MRKLRTILQSRYLFKIITVITLIFSIVFTNTYHHHSIYTETETVFTGKIIYQKIDGDKLTIIIKKKKNYY